MNEKKQAEVELVGLKNQILEYLTLFSVKVLPFPVY